MQWVFQTFRLSHTYSRFVFEYGAAGAPSGLRHAQLIMRQVINAIKNKMSVRTGITKLLKTFTVFFIRTNKSHDSLEVNYTSSAATFRAGTAQ